MQLLLPHTEQPSAGSERTSPQGLLTQSCQMLLLTREVALTFSALLHVWLNTKTSCVGPVHQATLAALSNSLSFVHPSASIHPMQKFYLQLFDIHCSIRCKHWITFDLHLDSGRIILGSSPLIAYRFCHLLFSYTIIHPTCCPSTSLGYSSQHHVPWNQMFSKNLLYLRGYI